MRRTVLVLTLTAGFLIPAMAQQPSDQQQASDDDGPGRGVARLSVLNGEVSVRRGDSGDVIAAALNAPLVAQDRVMTGPASRAELQFDAANMIRMGANAEVRLSTLDYGRAQVQVALGTTTFRVLRDSNAQTEISTPAVSIRPLGVGVYRVMVREDGSSEITVRSGEAEVYTPQGSQRLSAGSTMLARGSAAEPEFQIVEAAEIDGWDQWNDGRDRDLSRSQSAVYVGSDIYGAEELDNNGSWVDVPSYGHVWRPTVTAGWAPYQSGRWSWVDGYGWTWVSYDSWGWAPYHYGRWFYEGSYGGWCWWPGLGYGRPYWRPALVAFFGFGGHSSFHVGFGFGNVGWVPLAPFERYHPWYGRNGGYRGTTIVNNINITNVYRNSRVNNGISGMSASNFGRAGVNRSNLIRAGSEDLQRAGVVHGQLGVNPGRESFHMADRQANTSNLPQTGNRQFFSRSQAPAGAFRGSYPPGSPAGVSRGSNDNGGWHRFGDPAPHAQSPSVNRSSDTRFGGGNSYGQSGRGYSQPRYSQQNNQTPNNPQPQVQPNRGWSDRGRGSEAPQPNYRRDQSDRPNPYQSNPSYQQSRPQQYRGETNSAPIRISPPIVQQRSEQHPQRSAPSGGGGESNRGGGRSHGGGDGGGSHGDGGSHGGRGR